MILYAIFSLCFFVFLFFPLLSLGFLNVPLHLPIFAILRPVVISHIEVALLSALIALIGGILTAIGLLQYRGKRSGLLVFILLPSWVPALFVAISAHQLWQGNLPLGFWTVIWVQGLMNIGLVAAGLIEIFESRLASVAEASAVLGMSRRRFWFYAFGMLRTEIYSLFVLILGICFFSISIPLLLGGDNILTLEVLALYQMRMASDLGSVLGLAGLQLVIFLIFAMGTKRIFSLRNRYASLELVAVPRGILFGLIPSFLFLGGFLLSAKELAKIPAATYLQELVSRSLMPTLMVGLSVGALVFAVGALYLFLAQERLWTSIVSRYLTPSTLLIAFGFWFFPVFKDLPSITKIILAVSMSLFPVVMRTYGASVVSQVHRQWQVTEVLGASPTFSFFNVVLPGSTGILFSAAALAALWAVGDFALSSFVSSEDLTLGMQIHSLSKNYRVAEAGALMWVLAGVGLFCYFIFQAGRYVTHRKS